MSVNQSKPWWQGLLLGWLIMILTCLASLALIFFGYHQAALYVSVILGISFWALGMFKWKYEASGLAGILAIFIGIVVGLGSASYTRFKTSPVIRDISVSEVSKFPEAGAFYFTDAVVRTEFTYLKANYGSRASSNVTYQCIAPVVPANWEQTKPVSAWAVCNESYNSGCIECLKSFQQSHKSALVENKDVDVSALEKQAIAEAEAQYKFTTASYAPILTWTPDPFEVAKKNFQIMIGVGVALILVWTSIYFYAVKKKK